VELELVVERSIQVEVAPVCFTAVQSAARQWDMKAEGEYLGDVLWLQIIVGTVS
tara:strand:+ start:728 stop:889 length:162 start_codon:yes stop_codon:yes gene_type:complete